MMAVAEGFRHNDQKVGETDGFQLHAVAESTCPDITHALWQHDVGQMGHFTERHVVDVFHRMGNRLLIDAFAPCSHDDIG